MKKRTKRMETALKVIQAWASMDSNPHNMQSREDAMRDIERMASKALRKRWMASCRGPEIEHPSCYNRDGYTSAVMSQEFTTVVYPFRQSKGCPHWKPGGNAFVRPYCDSAGGKKTPWSACFGCRWK